MSKSNDWETPQSLFDRYNDEYCFTLDPCATKSNAKCIKFYTVKEDGLSKSWKGECVFMNPPYGRNIRKWMAKAWKEFVENGTTIVCLVPSRTDTIWWHEYAMKGKIIFLKGRLKFGGGKASAPFPSAIVIFG